MAYVKTKGIFNLVFMLILFLYNVALGDGNRPEDIVKKYYMADLDGARLTTEGYKAIKPLITWEDEPGWDEVFITKKAYISKIEKLSNNKLSIEVRYEILGDLEGADNLCRLVLVEVINFILIKENGQWKINSPIFPPHVSPIVASKHLEKLITKEKDKERVDKLKILIKQLKEM